MKYINKRECIWNPTSMCLGCPYQPTCDATLKDISEAMWEENQRQKEALNEMNHLLNKMRGILIKEID